MASDIIKLEKYAVREILYDMQEALSRVNRGRGEVVALQQQVSVLENSLENLLTLLIESIEAQEE